jgi:uncharacterized protein (DUF305 family)
MQKTQMSGDTDKEFKTIMYEYNRQGVEMAQTQGAHGKSAAMKAMARKIISAQMKDIAQFNQRRDKQK